MHGEGGKGSWIVAATAQNDVGVALQGLREAVGRGTW